MNATGGMSQERRRDLRLREVFDRCQPGLEHYGFHLDDRGSTEDCGWGGRESPRNSRSGGRRL